MSVILIEEGLPSLTEEGLPSKEDTHIEDILS